MRKLIFTSSALAFVLFAVHPQLFARSAGSVLMRAAYPDWDAPKPTPTAEPVVQVAPAPTVVALPSAPTMAHPLADADAFTRIGLEASWEKPNVILIMLSDRNARFKTGKAILTDVGSNEIKALAAVLNARTYLALEVDGHADRRGGYQVNMELSKQRARAVLTAAVDYGVPVDKFRSVRGWSYDHPLVQGTGPEVWGRNRRVEFRVITEP